MKRTWLVIAASLLAALSRTNAGERIDQEGRILGPLAVVTNSILFDTTNADAVVSTMQIFPVTSPYNENVSGLPLATNSSAIIAQISSDLPSSRRTLRLFQEMNYVLAPDNQPLAPIDFFDYPDQSDLNGGTYPDGAYPIPTNMPIEGWPTQTGDETLTQVEQATNGVGGTDRHGIIVQPGAGFSFETWMTFLSGTNWQAANGAIFNLNSNVSRPAGWTSGDAAGLSMFGAVVRFDECERGMVEHACRVVVERTLYNNYIYPATHYASASSNTQSSLPSMGQRLRLHAGFMVPTNWTTEEKALLAGLKKYGALVADNGGFFSISIAPDDRWPANAFDDISSPGIAITNFEVVQATGPTGGPRSPGAPTASAGPDESVGISQAISLQGYVSFTGSAPAVLWKLYSGPGTAVFANATQTNTTVSFSAPGVYTLEISADDGVHAVAYDAAVFTVNNSLSLSGTADGSGIDLTWFGGAGPFVVQRAESLPATSWSDILTTSVQNASFPLTNQTGFFRILSQ
ncbi:MAG TPA: hypothetical protein VMR33_01025 [Candidatus Baltobacteraceae bacterium]|nr:hypothetical protein [Candidatus Baltobacteraceae bacterium]